MALVREIGGYEVITMDELRDQYPEKFNESGQMDWVWFETEIRPNYFIYVRHDSQVDTLIHAAKHILEQFNREYECEETTEAIINLSLALSQLEARKERRKKEGTELT